MSPLNITLSSEQDNEPTDQHNEIHHLYSDHHSWLYAWLCKKLRCQYHAEDVAQNTFLRLFSFSNLANINEPRGFLTTTATRLLIDESRRKKVEQRYLQTYRYYHGNDEAVALSSEHIALVSEKLATIIQMLEGLPVKCQQAFIMSKFDGMRYADIATMLAVSTGMVQQYITKAMVAYYKICYEYDSVLTATAGIERNEHPF
ncbi:MAG: sigma-70 family RNA polymerase sigma factor [Gammaproteobacteria bacterium]|nr:sigma-70 family RNA polymerase sigma factor [Gammaproteobacteria bacterium]